MKTLKKAELREVSNLTCSYIKNHDQSFANRDINKCYELSTEFERQITALGFDYHLILDLVDELEESRTKITPIFLEGILKIRYLNIPEPSNSQYSQTS